MKLKQSQKMRVIVDGIHFYSTVKQIREGVGDHIECNEAIRWTYENFVTSVDDIAGIVCRYHDMNVQLDIV